LRLVEKLSFSTEAQFQSHSWELNMIEDVVFLALTIGFFALALGYVRGCDRLK
jgi:hypothetical protein